MRRIRRQQDKERQSIFQGQVIDGRDPDNTLVRVNNGSLRITNQGGPTETNAPITVILPRGSNQGIGRTPTGARL